MKTPKYIDVRGLLCLQILHKLKKKKLCGDELAEYIGNKKYGKLTPGTIYPALKFLRENKLIIFRQDGRKKIYKLTKKGEREYKIARRMFKKMFKELL
ncbi:winged helix-turn-helix domain-containing protein [archaeon]|nr:winged helix-turn-helix domain-containing protein [archaeon]